MPMKHVTTKAIILRRVNYEEADRIVSVITPGHGKVSLFAKGARRAKSKLAGGLELFSISDIVFIDSARDLKTIVSTRLDCHFMDIAKDVDRTMLAYEFLKLIDQNTQDSCDEQFYYLLQHALQALTQDQDLSVVRSWFYVQLLKLSGRGLNLESQTNGAPFHEELEYNFDFENMGFIAVDAQHSGHFKPRHIKYMRLLSKVDAPTNLLKVEHAQSLSRDIVELLSQCIVYGA